MDEEEEIEEAFPTGDPTPQGEELLDSPVSAVLCLPALVGFCSLHSMKVRGKILSREVVILIDSGAFHNFISNDSCIVFFTFFFELNT